MLTLKAPEDLVAELESFARERGVTRHAAALEAIKAGIAALRGRGDTEVIPDETRDTRGDAGRRVKRAEGWLNVHRNGLELGVMAIKTAVELLTDPAGADVPGALLRLRESALFELEPYLSGAGAPRPLAGSQKPEAARSVVEGGPVPESQSGRARRAPDETRRRTAEWLSTMMRKVTFRLPEELVERLEAEGAAMLSAGVKDEHRGIAGRHTSALALAARVAIESWLNSREANGKAEK